MEVSLILIKFNSNNKILGCTIPYPKREFLTDDDQEDKAESKRQAQQQQQQAQQTQQQQTQQSVGGDNHGNPAKRVRLGPHPGQVNPQVIDSVNTTTAPIMLDF